MRRPPLLARIAFDPVTLWAFALIASLPLIAE